MSDTAFTGLDPDALEARIRGTIRYAGDVAVPGMLHAALVRSHAPAGRLRSVDTVAAAAFPGVVRVVTAADLASLGLADDRFGTIVPDQPIFAADRVRHVGEPVGAVVAESEAAARAAVDLVRVVIDPLDPVLDADAALAPGAPLLHDDRPGNVLGRWGFSHGDLAAAEAATVHRFVGEYRSPAAQHVTFEPQVCVARWDGGTVEVWAATQSPSRVAAELARVFGIDPAAVRLRVPPLGGGYGAKNHAKIEPLAVALAALVGRPVRLANRRAEEFVTTTKHPARVRIESGVDGNGRFTFRRASILWGAGAYAHSSPAVMRAGALAVCGPYRIPAAEVESVMAYTNLPPAGSFRGLGANQATWAGESQVDEIARALGADPVDFRRRNVVRPGDRLATGERVDDAHWLECLDRVATATEARASGDTTGARRGTGVALAMKHTMTPSRSEAVVAALADGSIEVRSSLVDMGQGLRTVLSQAAARALDVSPETIRIVDPDTAITPFDATTSSSRGAWAGTVAVGRAARALREQLEAAGALALEAPPEAVLLARGRIVLAEVPPGSSPTGPTIAELVAGSGGTELAAHAVAVNEAPIDPETGVAASVSHWHQGAVLVTVEVDPDTGVVEVLEAHGAAWAGRVIDAGRARLQNEGGAICGLGGALFEELAFPAGRPSATTLLDYRIPSIRDVPSVLATDALETPGGLGEPTGLGESVIPAVAPAVGAAVADATGLRLRGLPLTPERVAGALAAAADVPWPEADADDPRVVDPTTPATRAPAPTPSASPTDLDLVVDGRSVRLRSDPLRPLRDVLADDLGIRSVRGVCGVGVCGACTVLVDGRAIRSCLRPVGLSTGARIETAEGLPDGDPVRDAFVAAGAAQCGTCIPGTVLAARDLLDRDPSPDDEAIRQGLGGNLCRCGTYGRILDAVRDAAGRRRVDDG
jgi:CO/xanthine dehydrogenase Mo-binding subunit/aerobic-type carbon monoxide dehydrogenase small subunit (CoxS/CutS family)